MVAVKNLNVYKEEIFRRGEARLQKRKRTRRRALLACLPLLLCGVIVGTTVLRPYLLGRGAIEAPDDGEIVLVPGTVQKPARLITVRSEKDGIMPLDVVNLMADVIPFERTEAVDTAAGHAAAIGFSVRLLQALTGGGENALIAPLSALTALGMIANGAAGETREQMQAALGISVETWNAYMAAARVLFASTDDVTFETFNSLWIDGREDFAVDADFLQTGADCYGADAFWVPTGRSMAEAINDWVGEKTRGRITDMANEADARMLLSLISALYFETDWETEWLSVENATFTCADGTEKAVSMMIGEEREQLSNDDGTITGFVKYYRGGEYAFAALVPCGDGSAEQLLQTLTGEELADVWQNRRQAEEPFTVGMPKFAQICDLSLKNALSTMGMSLVFDSENADFSGLGRFGDGSRRSTHEIGDIRQKTTLAADVNGEVDSAGTQVELLGGVGQNVILDHPFLYMIVHVESGVPVFIGILSDPTV